MDEKKALAVIEQHQKTGAIVCTRPEDLQTQKMFVPQVTVIHADKEDFHDRPINKKMMPKAHHVDRIGEAAGVEFVAEQCGTRKEGARCYVGWAQGRRRQPDGTFRTSSKQEYEFDVDVRAAEDFAKDKYNNYTTDQAKELHIIELMKAARQRASTGARLRVIRELVGIPIAFGPNDIQRALVVSRVAVNTDALLENPETRQQALAIAAGSTASIYGPEKDVTPQIEAPEVGEEVATEPAPDVDDFATFDAEPEDNIDNTRALRIQLEEWLLDPTIARSKDADKMIRDVLGNADATAEDIQAMIDRCSKYVAKHKGGAA